MNKKNIIIALVSLSILLLSSCKTKEDNNSFSLSGTIEESNAPSTMILRYTLDTIDIVDTAQVVEGKFEFKGKVTEPTIANIDNVMGNIWLEPTNMTIAIHSEEEEPTITGSKTQMEQNEYLRMADSVQKILEAEVDKLKEMQLQINKTKDKALAKEQTALLEEKFKAYQTKANSRKLELDFIKKHPESFYSGFILLPFSANENLNMDSVQALFNSLSPKVQNGYYGRRISKHIDLLKKNAEGMPAPDFAVFDPIHNKEVKLSSFKGQVVLMDFWSPYCGPCIQSFAKLKTVAEKHATDDFQIIAVYSDLIEDKDAWVKTIEKEGISEWHHVKIAEDMRNNKETENDIRSKYFVMVIPRKILIDQNGIIVKRWTGTSELIEKEVEEAVDELLKK